MGSGSNLVRPLWIGRLGFNPRGKAAARYRRRGIPRRRAGEPAGEGQTGVPRLGLGRGLAMAHVRDMGDALVALAGLKEVRGGAGSAAAGRRGETRWRARSCAALGTGAGAKDHARMRSAQARWNRTRVGSCCATGVLPWRSGGGETPTVVPGPQSGLRPN